MQKVPGWERNLDSIVEESVLKEVRVYQVECENLRAAKAEADQRLVSLQLQREAEMNATVAVIKFAQDKIESLHLQLKFQQKKEQQERQQRGNRKKGKKDSNNFNTPQVIQASSLSQCLLFILFLMVIPMDIMVKTEGGSRPRCDNVMRYHTSINHISFSCC